MTRLEGTHQGVPVKASSGQEDWLASSGWIVGYPEVIQIETCGSVPTSRLRGNSLLIFLEARFWIASD